MDTNEFIKRPVREIFFRYLIPAICGTMVTSIYVLADTIIVGKRLGETALAALNIALPIYNVFFGLGLLCGVGGSVLMSICRGKGRKEEGNACFSAALLLNLGLFLICLVPCTVLHGRPGLVPGRYAGDDALYHGLYPLHHLGHGHLTSSPLSC